MRTVLFLVSGLLLLAGFVLLGRLFSVGAPVASRVAVLRDGVSQGTFDARSVTEPPEYPPPTPYAPPRSQRGIPPWSPTWTTTATPTSSRPIVARTQSTCCSATAIVASR